jgi:hypothetical protein
LKITTPQKFWGDFKIIGEVIEVINIPDPTLNLWKSGIEICDFFNRLPLDGFS